MNQPPRGSGTGERERGSGENVGAVRKVVYRAVNGWHDLPQEDYEAAAEAIDALDRTIEQQQARIEELEAALRYALGLLHSGEVYDVSPILEAALNQNPPNPRSEG